MVGWVGDLVVWYGLARQTRHTALEGRDEKPTYLQDSTYFLGGNSFRISLWCSLQLLLTVGNGEEGWGGVLGSFRRCVSYIGWFF